MKAKLLYLWVLECERDKYWLASDKKQKQTIKENAALNAGAYSNRAPIQ